MRCSIHIDEIDGKLLIMGKMPDGADKTIAAALTQALLDASSGIMNTLLGENKKPERVDLQ